LTCALIGAVAGFLGEVFSINAYIKALVPLLCGIGMGVSGLEQLGLLRIAPILGKPFRFRPLEERGWKTKALTIGFLNAFMPCGSLQSMQLYALSTANALDGMAVMLVFSLATVPVLLTFGLLSSGLTSLNRRIASRIAGALVLVLAVSMIYKGITMIQSL
jgi:sulfite exporter TauE/SafE